jgi:hypothetical protein
VACTINICDRSLNQKFYSQFCFIQEEKKLKEKSQQDLIDDLMFSDTDANEIIAKHATNTAKVPSVSKILEESRNSVSNVIKINPIVEGTPFVYTEMVLEIDGPQPPVDGDIKSPRFTNHVRPLEIFERAAGFSEDQACLRSLQDAMAGLYYSSAKIVK